MPPSRVSWKLLSFLEKLAQKRLGEARVHGEGLAGGEGQASWGGEEEHSLGDGLEILENPTECLLVDPLLHPRYPSYP